MWRTGRQGEGAQEAERGTLACSAVSLEASYTVSDGSNISRGSCMKPGMSSLHEVASALFVTVSLTYVTGQSSDRRMHS